MPDWCDHSLSSIRLGYVSSVNFSYCRWINQQVYNNCIFIIRGASTRAARGVYTFPLSPLTYFSRFFNFEKLFFTPIFRLQFFLQMHIFSPIFQPIIFCPEISITVFQFFPCCAFCFLRNFQIEFFTRDGVRIRRARWSSQTSVF